MGFSLKARRQTNSNVPCRDSSPVRNHTPKTKTVPLILPTLQTCYRSEAASDVKFSCLSLISLVVFLLLFFLRIFLSLNKPTLVLFFPWLIMSLMTSGSTPDMRTEGGENGWKDARQRTGGDGGSGQIPPSPVCVWVTSQKKMLQPGREGVST